MVSKILSTMELDGEVAAKGNHARHLDEDGGYGGAAADSVLDEDAHGDFLGEPRSRSGGEGDGESASED